jgi:beta-lactamase regulating signal transducer with metallopeptidase domain
VLLAFAVVWLRRKRSASFLYAVLVVALLKFLVPPIIEIPVFESPVAFAPAVENSDATRTNTDETRTDTNAAPTPASIPPSTTTQRATAPANTASATNITLPAELPLARPPSPVEPAPAYSVMPHWKAPLALVHLTGAALLALVMAGSYLQLRRLLRAAQPATESLSSLANDVAARLRLRRPVEVLLTSTPCAPMATGLFKRRILLPEALTSLDSDEMRAVIAHELAHHRRMDLAFIWVEHLVTLLWWFNPLVWILVRAIHRKREDCCDDVVLSLGLAANSQYCKTLLHAAKRLHRSFTPRLVFGCASKLHPLGQRITRIMDTAIRRRAALTAGGIVVVTLMGLVLLPTFVPVAADTEETRTDTGAAQTEEAPASSAAASEATGSTTSSELIGVVRGVVTNGATGEPVSGAFVAIDHSGDAGGANLERFHEEGLYVTAETGADGRFALEGVALRDGHPFYVTAPGFVRHNESVSLTPQRPELALDVPLRPGATIVVALEQAAVAASAEAVFRLTAKDGRKFLPLRADWPAWPYRSEPVQDGAHEFSELAPGQFKVEAIQFAPESITYVGAVEIEVSEGETKSVQIGSQPRDTKVTITTARDPYQLKEQPRTVLTIGPELDVGLPPGYFVHPEDDRLGKILANAIVMHPALGQTVMQDAPTDPTTTTELTYEVTGLPEGNYTAAVYTVGSYPNFKSPSVYPRWMTFELKEHDAISVRIPWIEPKGPYVDQERIQSHPAGKVEEEISAHYVKTDPEIQEYIRWTASQFGSSGLWFAHDAFAQLTPEEREKKIVYHVEVLEGEYGRQLCRSLAEAGALKDARLIPGLTRAASYHREDSDYDCRPKWMAVAALGRQDDISVVPALVPLVDHGNQNTRMWARASLVRLTGQDFNDDKQAWGAWWNDSGHEPKIDLAQLKPWVMPGQTQTTTPPSPPALSSGKPQPAVVPPESMAVVDGLQGVVTFNATYHHRSRGSDIQTPSVLWLKPQVKGGIVAAAYLPAFNETTVARVSPDRVFFRYEVFGHGRGGRSPANRLLELGKGTVTIKHEGGEKDGEVETIAAPADGLFMPNSRPDSYTAHMALFFANVPDEGDADEVLCYDYGNDGKSMASYTIRLENVGKEEVTVPAGTFTANHVIENHLTFGDTWYKKRPGHITDYWVLDNGIVVRILRHREPYELQLASFTSNYPLPGVVQLNEGVTPVALGAAPTGNASAAVTVVHKNTNAGMPAVKVYVQGGPNGSIQRSGTTNANGHFTFGELPAGDYTVGCGAPKGYFETGSERVSVADGGKAEITLRLDPGIRISGLVVDLEGNPIAGAKVRARSWNQSGGSFNSGEVKTDSGGKYEIAGVPPGGEYRLFGSAEGHYSGYINVQPRGDLDGIDFTLGKGATVSGRAIDNEGNVVHDAQIGLMPDWNSWQEKQGEMNVMWGGQTPLDDSGNFTFSDVAPGKYNFQLRVRRNNQSFEQTSVGGPFEVEAGAVLSSVEAVFPAAESERIEGTVRDETGAPVPNVSVDAITYEGVHWGAKTDAEGRYKLVGLGDHTFDIYFFHDVLPDVVLRKVRPGVYDADAIMPHAGKISGVAINDVTGEPVREGSLTIVWHEAEYGFERGYRSEHQGGSIQQDGRFEIDRVLPGTAYFKVSAPGYLELQSPAVTVKAGQTTELVEMRLTPAAIVEGTVLANGRPLDVEQGISVMCLDDPIHEVPAGYIIHDGKYRLDRLPAGTYEIGAWARGRGHMADQKKRITVKAGDVTALNFVLEFPPPPESRTTP